MYGLSWSVVESIKENQPNTFETWRHGMKEKLQPNIESDVLKENLPLAKKVHFNERVINCDNLIWVWSY